MATTKDIIYLDIEDEITTIIDKVESSKADLVGLVLPKRASVLQSSVNIKLLKRAVDSLKKNLVLITTDVSVISLAADNKIYVAPDVSSKPEIPEVEENNIVGFKATNKEDVINLNEEELTTLPVSQLDKAAASIPIEDHSSDPAEETDQEIKEAPKPKHKKDRSLFIPNFHKFRLLFFLIVFAIIAVGFGIYYGFVVMPKAVINIKTNATNISVNVPLNLSTTATSVDLTSGTIPAKLMNYSKTYTATVPTTGQQYIGGASASGSVTLELANNCTTDPITVYKGSGISYGKYTYITQSDVTIFAGIKNGSCNEAGSAQTVNVVAVSTGAAYNLASGTAMTVAPSNGSYSSSDLSATSGGISGGQDGTPQQIATQTDVNSATAQINTNNGGAQNALEQQIIAAGLYPLSATLSTSSPTTTDSAAVGSVAANETVSEAITYSMYGVSKSNLENILNNSILSQVTSASQSIISNGFDALTFSQNNSSATNLTMTTTAEVGPNLSVANIKKNAVGKKAGDIIASLKNNPNITNVTVNISPIWISTVPSNLNKITVNIAKP